MTSRNATQLDSEVSSELHPELTPAERRHLIVQGLDLFNVGEYYDCHEAWEIVWRSRSSEPRDLWRGLIQIAVGFYHFHHRRRPDVALRVLDRGRLRVAAFLPETLGLDLQSLLAELEPWRSFFRTAKHEPPERPVLSVLKPELLR